MKKHLKKYWLIEVIIFITVIRIIMVAHLPIYAISTAAIDDALMVKEANSLKSFEWLGGYNQFTLVKGMMFPLFLAILNYIGISYTVGVTVFYIISIIIFVWVIKDKIKNKYALAFIYLLLLFNPATFGYANIQRVYRNSITPTQAMLMISCFMSIYFKIDNEKYRKTNYLWALGAGISLATFWNTREDSIWIIPFVIVITILTIVKIIFYYKKNKNIKRSIPKIIISILPVIVLILANTTISFINYKVYGINTVNELNNSNFTKAMKSIYAVKPEENIENVTVTREKLERIYKYSPTMESIKEYMNEGIDLYKGADRNPEDNEVEDGWFFWSFREAVARAGYYDNGPQEAESIYKKISDEIENVLNEGKLERQNVMPSALMPPWRKGTMPQLLNAMERTIKYVVSFDKIELKIQPSIDDGNGGIQLFETITNNKAIHPNQQYENEIATMTRYARRFNKIIRGYQLTGYALAVVGVIGYIYIIIETIKNIRKNKNYEDIDTVILLTGIIGSFIVLVAGVSYNEIASCDSINYMYLSGAYPLLLGFEAISICKLIEKIRKNKVITHMHKK